jgi:P-type Cu+ transporter
MLCASMRYVGMTETRHEEAAVVTTTLAVGGMTCGACERRVLKALDGMTGVIHVGVDLQNGRTTIEHVPAFVDSASLVAAVRDAGYEARVVQTVADAALAAPPTAARAVCGCGCCPPATT